MPLTQRQTAYKLRIGDILRGKPILEDERLNFLELGDKQIVRVNVVANIIDKFESEGERKFGSLTIDDASGQINIKFFGEDVNKFKDIELGNTIMVIGTLRYFNNQLYILPEIIKIKDPRYLLVRKLEIEKEQPQQPTPEQTQEKKQEIKVLRDQIIDMIKKEESNGGIDTEQIILSLKDSSPDLINQEIKKLLEEGVAYEPRPGMIRFLG